MRSVSTICFYREIALQRPLIRSFKLGSNIWILTINRHNKIIVNKETTSWLRPPGIYRDSSVNTCTRWPFLFNHSLSLSLCLLMILTFTTFTTFYSKSQHFGTYYENFLQSKEMAGAIVYCQPTRTLKDGRAGHVLWSRQNVWASTKGSLGLWLHIESHSRRQDINKR